MVKLAGIKCNLEDAKKMLEENLKNGKAYKGWLTYQGKKYYFYKGSSKLSGTRAENITLTSARKIVSVFNKDGICIRQYKKK